jgi:cell division protein FtsB
VDNDLLKYSLIKSLSRECDKHQKLLNKTGQQIHKYSDVELIGEINRRKCRNKLAKKLSSNLVKENEKLKEEIKELRKEIRLWRLLDKNKGKHEK